MNDVCVQFVILFAPFIRLLYLGPSMENLADMISEPSNPAKIRRVVNEFNFPLVCLLRFQWGKFAFLPLNKKMET